MKNDKILSYSAGVVGALVFGVVASQHAYNAGANVWMCGAFFVGGVALGVMVYYMIVTAIEMLFDLLMKGRVVQEAKADSVEMKIEEQPTKQPTQAQTEQPVDIKSEQPLEDEVEVIDVEALFKTNMFDQLSAIEQRWIADKYLTEDMRWVAKHANGKSDIQSLVTLLVGLMECGYFLPNRDKKIRLFFESRYKISLGQSFEPKRRAEFAKSYSVKFYNYPF